MVSVLRRVARRLRRLLRGSSSAPQYALADRNAFVGLIPLTNSVLEIGPFAQPVLRGPHVRYVDVLSTEDLRKRARALGMDETKVPNIGWVSNGSDLSVVNDTFDAVVSSHAIEHQPDFVGHLNQVADLLKPNGSYYLLVPDHRYCFDHFLTPSTVAQVLGAHLENRTVHSLSSVVEHRALTTHNDPARHWAGDHGDSNENRASRIASAIQEISDANGAYIDVHAWYFTPRSFREVITDLSATKHISFSVQRMFPTRPNSNEFWAILQKHDH
jgi:SAM-dependent methyltransferase